MSDPLYTGWLFHVEHGPKGFKNITMEQKADLIRDGWVDYHDRPKSVPVPVIDWSIPVSEPDESNLPVEELLTVPENKTDPKRRGPRKFQKVEI